MTGDELVAGRVRECLAAHGVAWHAVALPAPAHSAKDTARALGCEAERIVKSLVFRGRSSHRPILVLASGPNRVDEKKLGALFGERVERADPAFAEQHTGFAVGSVPPVGHVAPLPTFIDDTLLAHEAVWVGTGIPDAVCRLRPADLVAVSGGKVAAIA